MLRKSSVGGKEKDESWKKDRLLSSAHGLILIKQPTKNTNETKVKKGKQEESANSPNILFDFTQYNILCYLAIQIKNFFFFFWVKGKLIEGPLDVVDKYSIKINVDDIHSFRKHIPSIGYSFLTITCSDGVSHPPFYFHEGGLREFLNVFGGYCNLRRFWTSSLLFSFSALLNINFFVFLFFAVHYFPTLPSPHLCFSLFSFLFSLSVLGCVPALCYYSCCY